MSPPPAPAPAVPNAPHAPSRAVRWLSRAALGVAVAALGLRFANFDLVAFILDEPQFLAAAGEQLLTGHWVSASPLVGTQGVTYGPSVLWFYGAVQALVGPAPERSVLAMCLLLTASHLALALALARLLRGGTLLAAVLVGLVAASPYQFFWSRLAWDQLVNVCTAWAVVLLATQERPGPGRSLVLGAVLGVAVSSHLMVLPFTALVVATLAWELRAEPRRLAWTLAALLGALVAVNVPYLVYLSAHPPPPLPATGPALELLVPHLLQPARVATVWGIDYFFDAEWQRFVSRYALARALDAAALPLLAAVLITAAAGIALALRSAERGTRRIARLAALVWLGYAAFYSLRALNREPHYQFPTAWVVLFGIGALVQACRLRSPPLRGLALGSAAALICLQLGFILQWMDFIRAEGGTRGPHYSTPLRAQQALLAAACRSGAGLLVLQNETGLFAPSLLYIARSHPDCRRREVAVCRGACPAALQPLRLRYAAPGGGALTVE